MARSASKLRSTRSGVVKLDFLLRRIADYLYRAVCSFPSACAGGSNTTTGIARPAAADREPAPRRREKRQDSRCPGAAVRRGKVIRTVVVDFAARVAPRCALRGFRNHGGLPGRQRSNRRGFVGQK